MLSIVPPPISTSCFTFSITFVMWLSMSSLPTGPFEFAPWPGDVDQAVVRDQGGDHLLSVGGLAVAVQFAHTAILALGLSTCGHQGSRAYRGHYGR